MSASGMSTRVRFDVPAAGQQQPHTWVVGKEFLICLTQQGDISDALWSRFVKDVGRPEIHSVLGLSYESVNVTSLHRKALTEALKGKTMAAVLKSSLTRGIITALGWLGLNVKAFSWDMLDDAVRHVGITECSPDEIRALVSELLVRSSATRLEDLVRGA